MRPTILSLGQTPSGIHSLSVNPGETLDFKLLLMNIEREHMDLSGLEYDAIVRIQYRLKDFLVFERISPLVGAQVSGRATINFIVILGQ